MHRDNDNDMQEALKDAIAADKPVFESGGPRKRKSCRMLKMARWSFLANEDKMNFKEKVALQDILAEHENQAICYSMKEEMIALYEFRAIQGCCGMEALV